LTGKSAVAAAIQLCLGATARNTGRGSSLSNLVREGSNEPAIIRVTMLNTGADAYMPEVYGSRITVERKIARTGGVGGYSIKGENDKVIQLK
jgi:chromosome segregation ATPase